MTIHFYSAQSVNAAQLTVRATCLTHVYQMGEDENAGKKDPRHDGIRKKPDTSTTHDGQDIGASGPGATRANPQRHR